MKAYVYSPAEAGLSAWPSGELRLEGFATTTNPDEADVFVCPGSLSLFQSPGALDKLPYMSRFEDRHVFFDVSDNFTKALNRKCIFIKCDQRVWMNADDPNAIPFAWPVKDFKECVDVPDGGFKYDLSFHAWRSPIDTRPIAAQSCKDTHELKSDIAIYDDFTGYHQRGDISKWTPEGLRRWSEFRRSMKESRIALCPESIPGVLPYRFFEAMSAGRVPLLVSTDFRLPFEREIPYSDFTIVVDRENANAAGEVALNYIRSHTDDEIIAKGILARAYWVRWLDSSLWPQTMAYAVKQALRRIDGSEEPKSVLPPVFER